MKYQWFVASKDNHNGITVTMHKKMIDAFREYKNVIGGLFIRKAWGKCPDETKPEEIKKRLRWERGTV